ncbi:NAD(P)H-dependent oxidoreductase [Candidatus Villigracilis affinis]|uniref:NAD(P)H-dependent oxidoreductase n=1 Tax=Candidatus Villigracilis affinis TaxID=3140682 RepID=UPI001DCF0426|nr:NAD(P)H-dependent oxidoreductase [Anaerolineales bacterium]
MKTLILDGSLSSDAMGGRVVSHLQNNLAARGWSSETVTLREKKIGNCAGDFFCWMRSPGVCNVDDDNRDIAEKIIASDLVIYLTPITFGGYSSTLKRMVDHQIQNISPFFTSINGEIHHQKRYASYPHVVTIGWLDGPNANAESVFRHLAYRNSLNMYSQVNVCGVAYGNQTHDELDASLNLWLTKTERFESDPVPALPTQSISSAVATPVRRALLLVGSPRTRKSTSASLGGYLFDQLNRLGVEIETMQIYTSLNSQERMKTMYEAVDRADLIVLAFPLYVDSLPAPVISALEKINQHCLGKPSRARFAAIANCGFPEAHHNDTALAVCAEFASSNGLEWMGSLALGGGEGLVHGVPLAEMDGRAIPIKRSLDLAAEALASGQPIPQSARDLLAKPVIPNWLYKMFGGFGWKQQAKQYGVQDQLKARPYLLETKGK